MEQNTGLQSLLQHPRIYSAFQRLAGGSSAKHWLVENQWRIEPGMTVVDIGCGPGNMRADLPADIEYYGFDPNPDYIASAKNQHNGTFVAGVMQDFLEEYGGTLAGKVDVVICCCVLHHLTIAQIEDVFTGSLQLLKSNGRYAGIEPTLLAHQGLLSKWVMSMDRGCNILHDFNWREILASSFPECEVRVLTHLLRIPYTHVTLTGWKT